MFTQINYPSPTDYARLCERPALEQAALGSLIALDEKSVGIYLAVFSGFVIYLATSHILPEAHAKHSSKLTMMATFIGIVIMWLVVANLPHE